ncbi:1-deoxy-D-xylulose-5-phosphate synthase OS=Streptomyces albaduncus OX=68172 GN=dxs PE=3 SV=1 [Streptomyces griseoloalbus]
MDVLREPGTYMPDVLLVSVGALDGGLEIASLLDRQGISATVVDPRWVKPVDEAMAPLAAKHRVVVTVEDKTARRRRRLRDRPGAARRRGGHAAARLRHPAALPRPRLACRGHGGDRVTAPDVARHVTGLVAKLDGR